MYRKCSEFFFPLPPKKNKQAHREMGGCHNIIKKPDFSRSLTFPSLVFFVCLPCCPCLYPHVFGTAFYSATRSDWSGAGLPGLRYTQQRLRLHLCFVECCRDLLSSSVSVQDVVERYLRPKRP